MIVIPKRINRFLINSIQIHFIMSQCGNFQEDKLQFSCISKDWIPLSCSTKTSSLLSHPQTSCTLCFYIGWEYKRIERIYAQPYSLLLLFEENFEHACFTNTHLHIFWDCQMLALNFTRYVFPFYFPVNSYVSG